MQNGSKYSSILLIASGAYPENNIQYFDTLGNKKHLVDKITRILNEEEEEVVLLESGFRIPISKIYSVDHEISPYYTDEFYKCDCV